MPIQRIRDDMGHELTLPGAPKRVVSLVPSETDTLFALGLGDRIVGRTRYCVEPAGQVDTIPIVGGTKDIDIEAIKALEPDLILGNQEENSRPPLEKLLLERYRVFISFPKTVAAAAGHVARLVRMFERSGDAKAKELVRGMYELTTKELDDEGLVPTFVPIWRDPLMTFSGETFAHDALRYLGAINVFEHRERKYPLAADLSGRPVLDKDKTTGRDTRYPRLSEEELVAAQPEQILLPDEPYEFGDKDLEYFRSLDIPAAKNDKIRFVSGKSLFWPGPRLLAQQKPSR